MHSSQNLAPCAANCPPDIGERTAALDWQRIAGELDRHGAALGGNLLAVDECAALIQLYPERDRFRSQVIMQRHGFGQGEYRYFAYPLPPTIAALRTALYAPLVDIANCWHAALGNARRFPPTHEEFVTQCHGAGQQRPTPLLLRYVKDDYNCLHQDVYGEQIFPFQATLLLSAVGEDFTGGEFVLTEQRPRRQSRAEVVPLSRGEIVIFAVRHRPVQGTRGVYRATLRHGVSRLRSGERYSCGIIFHDAA